MTVHKDGQNRSPEALWKGAMEALRPQLGSDTITRWFEGIVPQDREGERLVLRVPNSMHQIWIEANYLPILQTALAAAAGARVDFRFVTAPDGEREPEPESSPAPTKAAGKNGAGGGTPLNPRYTFESFVVGSNSQLAHAACVAVAQAPARTYNPLFLYGSTGLGKTHLMHALGHAVQQKQKSCRVVYISSEQFTNDFIDAISTNSLVRFRKRYRQADVLLIDDIHFLSGKERSQEEFFHTFNALFDGHKQIVLTSDRPASEIANLQQRMVTRFEWGLTATLQPPDMETRLAILRKKAQGLEVRLENRVMEFLAERVRSDVRRLEGALMRVAAFASLSGKEPSRESVEHLLGDILREEARRAVTIDQIQRQVAEHFDIRLADMTSKRRPKNVAFPRQVAMYFARELTKSSLAEIGEAFGGRDHGTVIHAHRKVRERMTAEDQMRQIIGLLESKLQH